MRRWLIRWFERVWFHRLYHRRRRPWISSAKAGELRQAVQGLDTVWRAATYVEAAIDQELPGSLWDVPAPPEKVLEERRGTVADSAHLAQVVLALAGKEAFLCSVYDRELARKEVVCAVVDGGMWHHISGQGMFGVYESLEEIADDLIADWGLMVVRDAEMRIVAWKEGRGDSRSDTTGDTPRGTRKDAPQEAERLNPKA